MAGLYSADRVSRTNPKIVCRNRGGGLKMNSFDDDQAGYGKPPKRFRFKKGRSGNPSGKPGAKKHSSVLMTKALLRLVPVKRDGGREKITKLQAVATQMVNR